MTTRCRRPLAFVAALLLVLALSASAVTAAPASRDLAPFRGLGAWVDAYDYAAAFQLPGQDPAVTPDSLADMRRLGVRTLYLQASKDDTRSPEAIVDRALVGQFLVRAHRLKLRVVAWYLPKLADLVVDEARVRALRDFRAGGQRFDGLALDVEWTRDVPDVPTRNDRLVTLTAYTRRALGSRPLGAIVLPPVQLEVINPLLWPDFPWARLKDAVDVWMPMSYWTFRSAPYRDAFTYTDESTRRLRADLGDPKAPVHEIGGIADESTRTDYEGFARAVEKNGAIGWSVYDYDTTRSSAWPALRAIKGS